MNALLIILGIFIYLTVNAVITNYCFQIEFFHRKDKDIFGVFVVFLPIMLLYMLPVTLGKWIAKTIYDKIRLYKYNKSYKKSIRIKAKQTI